MPQQKEFDKLLFAGLYEVANDAKTYAEREGMIDKIYTRISNSTKKTEEVTSIGQVSNVQEFSGRMTELDIAPGYSTKYEQKEFGGFLETSRMLLDQEQYGVFTLANNMSGLVESDNNVKEDNAVKPIANATSAAYDFISSQEEGVALASNSHKTKATNVSTASGFDNLGTSALNKTAIAATRINMLKFRTNAGRLFRGGRRWGLLVPISLEFKAKEAMQTPWGLDSGQRNENLLMNIAEVIVWNRMEEYSSVNWAMIDLDMMKKMMLFFDQVSAEPEVERVFMTKAVRQSIYSRYSLGPKDWRWGYIHKVS